MAHLVEVGLSVVAESGVGIGNELKAVAAALDVDGDVQGLVVAPVLHGVVEVDDRAETVVVTDVALQFLALGIGAVEIITAVLAVVVRNTNIGPRRQPVLHDDVGLS